MDKIIPIKNPVHATNYILNTKNELFYGYTTFELYKSAFELTNLTFELDKFAFELTNLAFELAISTFELVNLAFEL